MHGLAKAALSELENIILPERAKHAVTDQVRRELNLPGMVYSRSVWELLQGIAGSYGASGITLLQIEPEVGMILKPFPEGKGIDLTTCGGAAVSFSDVKGPQEQDLVDAALLFKNARGNLRRVGDYRNNSQSFQYTANLPACVFVKVHIPEQTTVGKRRFRRDKIVTIPASVDSREVPGILEIKANHLLSSSGDPRYSHFRYPYALVEFCFKADDDGKLQPIASYLSNPEVKRPLDLFGGLFGYRAEAAKPA